jgi:hypothetical protein
VDDATCSAPDCERNQHRRRLCHSHYIRVHTYECAWCGGLIDYPEGARIQYLVKRHCSTGCQRLANQKAAIKAAALRVACVESAKAQRKRPAILPFKPSKAFRLAIYERDSWTCQLCGDPVDRSATPSTRLAPSLDHIECQSWALIPDHSAKNLRLAHRRCNSKRGNRVPVASAVA